MSMKQRFIKARYYLHNAARFAKIYPEEALIRAVVIFSLVSMSVFFIVPLYWLFSAAFKPPNSVGFPPELVPSTITFENLNHIIVNTEFVGTFLVNSLLVAVGAVIIVLAIATPAGYAFSRYEMKHKRVLMVSILFVQMIPFLAMIIPLYRIFAIVGLLDTLIVITLVSAANTIPVATWLMKGYFDTVPDGLEEAARVGGASRFQAFRIITPLAKPALGAVAIYSFVGAWNKFIIPLTFTSSKSKWVLPVALYKFISRRGVVEWGLLGAATLIAMLPVLILFVVFQKQFVAGLTGAEYKG
ncbi:carbohydrate ABC transporter permease [Halorhabdus amylolytica]|uniref:carbohydrate ABC transporter permease n=1 Tax=Halorhabdus amylolytica TaxID=2559573 RepID=UPI0010AA8A77|nr:carbohydrate ABC transporter permease [Halorhabdus amylolytica]